MIGVIASLAPPEVPELVVELRERCPEKSEVVFYSSLASRRFFI